MPPPRPRLDATLLVVPRVGGFRAALAALERKGRRSPSAPRTPLTPPMLDRLGEGVSQQD